MTERNIRYFRLSLTASIGGGVAIQGRHLLAGALVPQRMCCCCTTSLLVEAGVGGLQSRRGG